MSLFSFFKRKQKTSAGDQALVDSIAKSLDVIANTPLPKPMSNEEYSTMRTSEEKWFETHFDLTTTEGIKKVPNKKGVRCPSTTGVTGQLYYYLRKKSYWYEAEGKIDLALACMEKSYILARLDYGKLVLKQELYPYIKILARNGDLEKAIQEKKIADKICIDPENTDIFVDFDFEVKKGKEARDYFWIKENIPKKCPKSVTGYRRMKTQNTKNYQILKQLASELGREI